MVTLVIKRPTGGELRLERLDVEEAVDFARANTTGPWHVTDQHGRRVAMGYARKTRVMEVIR